MIFSPSNPIMTVLDCFKASPALWSVYLDLLIKELRELGVGCHVGGLFMGVVVYADDVQKEQCR